MIGVFFYPLSNLLITFKVDFVFSKAAGLGGIGDASFGAEGKIKGAVFVGAVLLGGLKDGDKIGALS